MNKFEHSQGVSCRGRGGAGGLVSLYAEVKCIMGNGHMGPPPVNRQTDTSLAGVKNRIEILTDTPE